MPNELIPYNGEAAPDPLMPGQMLVTFPVVTVADQVKLARAVQNSDYQLEDLEGKEIAVQDVVAHWAPYVDRETGECGESVRTCMIAPDGTRYSTRSEYVPRDLQLARQVTGQDLPWRPALRFVVRRPTNPKTKRRYLQLEFAGVDELAAPEEPKGRRKAKESE